MYRAWAFGCFSWWKVRSGGKLHGIDMIMPVEEARGNVLFWSPVWNKKIARYQGYNMYQYVTCPTENTKIQEICPTVLGQKLLELCKPGCVRPDQHSLEDGPSESGKSRWSDVVHQTPVVWKILSSINIALLGFAAFLWQEDWKNADRLKIFGSWYGTPAPRSIDLHLGCIRATNHYPRIQWWCFQERGPWVKLDDLLWFEIQKICQMGMGSKPSFGSQKGGWTWRPKWLLLNFRSFTRYCLSNEQLYGSKA